MFTYADHVGLYAKQVSATGDQVGNFPQAFTHLALISSQSTATAHWTDSTQLVEDAVGQGP